MKLTTARLQTILWTSRKAEAAQFYGEVLGLNFQGESHGALVYDVSGGELRVSPVPSTEPSAHTVLGFAVSDLDAVLSDLDAHGVPAVRHPGFNHAPNGAWTAPDGARVGWFLDPDSNLLSIIQWPEAHRITRE